MPRSEHYMKRALDLARKGEGRTCPNPPVGALVVCDGEVTGEGFHPQAGKPHAEIYALKEAGQSAIGADLYVTLEPCSHHGKTGPCTEAVIAAGIKRVFVGTVDPNPLVAGRGVRLLEEAGIAVKVGVLEKDCRRLIAPFAKHVTTGLPFVILKSAITLDGKTATSTGDSQWISGLASREYVHRVRDKVDAVMIGIGTALRDNPQLTTRLPEGGHDAARLVVDSKLTIPEDAKILNLESMAPTIIATTHQAPEVKIQRLREKGAQILQVAEKDGNVDLRDLLRQLGAKGIQSILLEGGARINASAIQAGIVDRVMFFIAPKIIGGNDGKGIFSGFGVENLDDALLIDDVRTKRFGADILIEGEVRQCSRG